MKTVLMVAEKPSIASSIANALSMSDLNNVKKGSMPLYSFEGIFNEEKVIFKVTSVAGHVFSCDFAKQYQNWDIDPVELFDAETRRVKTSPSIVRHLESCGKNMDILVLWLDCDREGENICFEVLSVIFKKKIDMRNVFRARFSAITARDIKKALLYKNLVKPNRNESDSVDARQELDLKIGVAFSRFQTKYFKNKFVLEEKTEEEIAAEKYNEQKGYRTKKTSSVLSYGPCQMPTLFFCAERKALIHQFKSEKYYSLRLTLTKKGQQCKAQWSRKRIFSSNICKAFQFRGEAEGKVVVTNVSTSRTKKTRPLPLNTVSLLKAASSKLGMGPQTAMKAAEHLYLSGYLSYPRTESNKYPKSFNFKETVGMFTSHYNYGVYARNLVSEGISYSYNSARGIDAGDHPPITPVRFVEGLTGDTGRLYDYVVRHFLASIGQNATFSIQNIQFKAGLEKFKVTQRSLISAGFLEVLLNKSKISANDAVEYLLAEDEEDEELGSTNIEFVKGEVYEINGRGSLKACIEIVESMTKPPGLLSESELIDLMEKNRIGTDASISVHIQNIINRNYVKLKQTGSRRILEPTKLGLTLVQGYFKIDHDLVLPKVRAEIEKQCNLIAVGKKSKGAVVKKTLALFKAKFKRFREEIIIMESLFQKNFKSLADKIMELGVDYQREKGRNLIWSRSGTTKTFLIFLGRPDRLYDRKTEETFYLPRGGKISQSNGVMCPQCSFEISYFAVGNPARTFPLCPNCFNIDCEDHRAILSVSPHKKTHLLCQSRTVKYHNGITLVPDCKKANMLISIENGDVYMFSKGLVKAFDVLQKKNESLECTVKIKFNEKNQAVLKSGYLSQLPNYTFVGFMSTPEIWKLLNYFPDKNEFVEEKATNEDPNVSLNTKPIVGIDKQVNENKQARRGNNKSSRGRGRKRGTSRKMVTKESSSNEKGSNNSSKRSRGRGRGGRRRGNRQRGKRGRGRGKAKRKS